MTEMRPTTRMSVSIVSVLGASLSVGLLLAVAAALFARTGAAADTLRIFDSKP